MSVVLAEANLEMQMWCACITRLTHGRNYLTSCHHVPQLETFSELVDVVLPVRDTVVALIHPGVSLSGDDRVRRRLAKCPRGSQWWGHGT